MEQKYINQRIAIAMLKQCALLWEMWLSNPKRRGEYSLMDVCDGLGGGNAMRCKGSNTGNLIFLRKAKYPEVFREKLLAIDGTRSYDSRYHRVNVTIPTSDTNPDLGFGCNYNLKSVFFLSLSFCRSTGCLSLLKKTVFGYDSNGKYSYVPELKAQRVDKPSKPKSKTQVLIEPAVAAQIRTALAAVEVA